MKTIMKKLMMPYLKLYCKVENDIVKPDHRNIGHGFIIGTIIWAVVFLAIAEILKYKDWVAVGFVLATITCFLLAFAWEKYQAKDPNKRFSWRDILASNFWFLPIYILFLISSKASSRMFDQAKTEFKSWWEGKGKTW